MATNYSDWWKQVIETAPYNQRNATRQYQPPGGGGVSADFVTGTAQLPFTPSVPQLSPYTEGAMGIAPKSPSPLDVARMMQGRAPLGGTAGEIQRFRNLKKGFGPGTEMPTREELPTDQGGGGGGSSLDKIFGPLFDALEQQRRNAESRYTANVGQIQNIYGQLIGARGADINDIQDAYNNLQQAASARGAATLGAMQAREQQRQSQNQAVLQSMGVGDIGSAAMDQAAEASQVAQDVAALGQSNWAGLLGAMGATAQDIARADITGYGYRQGEDIAALQGAKEDYLQGIGQQEFELKSQQALKELEAQQAAAAAQAKAQAAAAEAAAKAQEQQFDQTLDYLKTLPPLDRAFGEESLYRGIAPESRGNVETAYNTWLESASGSMGRYGDYTPATALQEIYTRNIAQQLSPEELTALKKAILYTFQNQ